MQEYELFYICVPPPVILDSYEIYIKSNFLHQNNI